MQTMMTTMMRHAYVRGLQFTKLGCALVGQMVIDVLLMQDTIHILHFNERFGRIRMASAV